MSALENLIHETTTTTGTGNMTTAAVRRKGSAAFGTGDNGANNPIIFIHNRDVPTEYEIAPCYWSDANTMVRGTPVESSNSNATVNFSAGTKDITNDIPASKQFVPDRELFDGVSLMAMSRALGVAQFAGDRFADSFGALTYVDTAGATNLDSATPGLLKPNSDSGGSETSATPGADAGNGGYTFVEMAWAVDNGRRVSQIGVHSTSALTFVVKLFKRNSASNFDVVVSESFSHGGTGWEDKTISSVYNIPESGTYYAGVYCASNFPTQNGAHTVGSQLGNITGVGQTITELSSKCPGVRVTYQAYAENATVFSTGITPVNNPSRVVLVARVKHVDAATAGTDYNFQISRNGGSDYSSNMTLYDRFTDPTDSCHVIESDPMDVSGQTSPTTIMWKWITANNKNVELRDIYLRAVP